LSAISRPYFFGFSFSAFAIPLISPDCHLIFFFAAIFLRLSLLFWIDNSHYCFGFSLLLIFFTPGISLLYYVLDDIFQPRVISSRLIHYASSPGFLRQRLPFADFHCCHFFAFHWFSLQFHWFSFATHISFFTLITPFRRILITPLIAFSQLLPLISPPLPPLPPPAAAEAASLARLCRFAAGHAAAFSQAVMLCCAAAAGCCQRQRLPYQFSFKAAAAASWLTLLLLPVASFASCYAVSPIASCQASAAFADFADSAIDAAADVAWSCFRASWLPARFMFAYLPIFRFFILPEAFSHYFVTPLAFFDFFILFSIQFSLSFVLRY